MLTKVEGETLSSKTLLFKPVTIDLDYKMPEYKQYLSTPIYTAALFILWQPELKLKLQLPTSAVVSKI